METDTKKSEGRGWSGFVELLRSSSPSRRLILLAMSLSVAEAVGGLIVPLFTKDLIDGFAVAGLSIRPLFWLIGAFLVQTIAGGFSFYLMTYIGETFVAHIRGRLWQHVLRLRVAFFDKEESGALMSRITQDTDAVKTLVTQHAVTLVGGLVSILGAIGILFLLDWRMTLLMLGSVPAAMLILMPLGRKVYRIALQTQDEMAKFSGSLGRVLSDIRLVKAYNAQHAEQEKGGDHVRQLFRYGLREARIHAVVSPLMTAIMLAVLVVLIGYGGARVAAGELSAGSLVAVILYMFQIVMPFSQLATFSTALQKAMGATERIQELLQQEGEGEAESSVVRRERARTERAGCVESASAAAGEQTALDWRQPIVFDRVTFGYTAEAELLKHIQFQIDAGRTFAFVGPSGSGKTTIFSLIEQFYAPTSGCIRLGSADVRDLPLHLWREGIGYVQQDSPVMSGTIRDNISYGLAQQVEEEAVVQAARLAHAADFIEQLEDRYDTLVGERGMKLSGGQRQRIAIARAFLRNPKLLLLDEATSNLDSESEALIQQALRKLMEGRTTLIIAHRLSTVLEADRIFFLDQGSITGEGTHEHLMDTHERYRKFVQQQMVHLSEPVE